LPGAHELSIIPTIKFHDNKEVVHAPADSSRLTSVHPSSSIGTASAKGPHLIISFDSIFVGPQDHAHFFKTEVCFNAVLFSLNQVQVFIGNKEINRRSPQ